MKNKMKMYSTDRDVDKFHKLMEDNPRKRSFEINRDMLDNLLMDHHRMVSQLEDHGVTFEWSKRRKPTV
jgi:hypothetical protein